MKVAQNNLLFETRRTRKKSGSYKGTSDLLPKISAISEIVMIFRSFDDISVKTLCFKTRRNFKVSMHCRSVPGSAYISVHYIPVKLEGLHWVKV